MTSADKDKTFCPRCKDTGIYSTGEDTNSFCSCEQGMAMDRAQFNSYMIDWFDHYNPLVPDTTTEEQE